MVPKPHPVSRLRLDSELNSVPKLKLDFKPNLFIKCSLDLRHNLDLSYNTVSKYLRNPKGSLKVIRIKIIINHRLILIKNFSNYILPLLVKLVTNGLLAVKIWDNNQVMELTCLTIALMDKILME